MHVQKQSSDVIAHQWRLESAEIITSRVCGGAGVGQVTESAIGGVAERYPASRSGCSVCSDAVAVGRVLDGVGFNSLGAIRHLTATAYQLTSFTPSSVGSTSHQGP